MLHQSETAVRPPTNGDYIPKVASLEMIRSEDVLKLYGLLSSDDPYSMDFLAVSSLPTYYIATLSLSKHKMYSRHKSGTFLVRF